MRDSIDLRYFDKGLYSNPDQEDIPNEAQTEGSYNLDVDSQGKLKGVPTQESASIYGYDGVNFGWIERNNGKWDLIYTDGDAVRVIYDFYGTQTHATLIADYGAEVIISNNREVHIGRTKDIISAWVGYISHAQFGGTVPTGLQIENSMPAQPGTSHSIATTVNATAVADEDAKFPRGFMYHYKFSFIYDGYQESPLNKPTGTGLEMANSTCQITTNTESISVLLTLAGVSGLSKRITGVNVYRREKPYYDSTTYADYQEFLDTTAKLPYNLRPQRNKDFVNDMENLRYSSGSFGDYGEFKLIRSIDINDDGWTGTTNKVFTVTDTNYNVGASYYSNVGIPEDEHIEGTYYSLSYGLGATSNNMLFVSNADHYFVPDDEAAHMIFRSKPYRFDTFDWVNDKLVMPTIPKAMQSHRGKLYVWDENTTYVIDPISFQIEKTITGRGCASPKSVVDTDYGLFWANKNGVYWSEVTANILKPVQDDLSEPIKAQYQAAASSSTPKLVYNSARSQLLVHLDNDIFAYNTVEKRWDLYNNYKLVSQEDVCGAFTGKDGETYTVTDNDLYKDFASSTPKSWVFISKEFTLDDPSQDKKFYKIIKDSSGTLVTKYSLDGGSTWVTFTDENIGMIRGKTIRLYISGQTTATLDSASILYRRLRGKR